MQELEAKYLIASGRVPEDVLRRLQQSLAWAGFRIQADGRRHYRDVYFDTADQALRGAGWSYRCRNDAGTRRLGLKEITRSRAAVFDRQELEQVVPGGGPADVEQPPPGPVRDRLQALLKPDARLTALFAVEKERASYRLTHPDHPRGVVEMAWDQARIGGGDIVGFAEIELELLNGSHELLAAVMATAELEPGLFDARLSKYERGLIAAGCPLERRRLVPPQQFDRHSRWLDVAATRLKAQLYQIKLYEPYAWEGVHPEGVHQMRVATRRARAALKTFRQVLPEAEAKALSRGLRDLAAALGDVRDLDVHLGHLTDYQQRLRPNERRLLTRYEHYLRSLLHRERQRLLDVLSGTDYLTLVSAFRALLAALGRTSEEEAPRVADIACQVVEPALTRLLAHGRAIDDDAPADRLHRLRVDAKRLRYQLEALSGAWDGELEATVAALKKLQDVLGLHQDACVARAHLKAYRREHAAGKAERRLLKSLMKLEKHRARRHRHRFAKAWRRFEAAAAALPERL